MGDWNEAGCDTDVKSSVGGVEKEDSREGVVRLEAVESGRCGSELSCLSFAIGVVTIVVEGKQLSDNDVSLRG